MVDAYLHQIDPNVHRLRVGEAVAVGGQVALSILPFLCNISFQLSCTAQMLILSYQCLLTVVLECVVVVVISVKLPHHLSICELYKHVQCDYIRLPDHGRQHPTLLSTLDEQFMQSSWRHLGTVHTAVHLVATRLCFLS
jgi:hypothetical protein